jgi:hypothetical protein
VESFPKDIASSVEVVVFFPAEFPIMCPIQRSASGASAQVPAASASNYDQRFSVLKVSGDQCSVVATSIPASTGVFPRELSITEES